MVAGSGERGSRASRSGIFGGITEEISVFYQLYMFLSITIHLECLTCGRVPGGIAGHFDKQTQFTSTMETSERNGGVRRKADDQTAINHRTFGQEIVGRDINDRQSLDQKIVAGDLGDRMSFYLLELPRIMRYTDEYDSPVAAWCRIFRNFSIFAKSRSERDAEFDRLERAMRVSGLDDKEIDNYFSDMMTEKEMRPYIEGAEQQGYRKGFEAGAEQGRAEGVEKGIEKGIEKGYRWPYRFYQSDG